MKLLTTVNITIQSWPWEDTEGSVHPRVFVVTVFQSLLPLLVETTTW